MYARRPAAPRMPRQRKSDVKVFGSPIGGWIANRALSNPQDGPQGAAVLDNIFPTATGAMLRRGRESVVTLGGGTSDVLSLFSYNFGNNEGFFGATNAGIYAVPSGSLVYNGVTNGRWDVVQFGATGNTYLIGVNGADLGFIYDGADFWPNVKGGISSIAYNTRTAAFTVGGTLTGVTSGATAVIVKVVVGSPNTIGTLYIRTITGTFQNNEIINGSTGGSARAQGTTSLYVPGVDFGAGVTSADMSFVWVYKNALYFLRKDSLSFYYLPVDSIGGTATQVSLAGVLTIGGKLIIGQGWSLDTGQQGGLSEQCVFMTDEGEIAVYQGLSPAPGQGWGLVGVYRIGRILGDRAWVRAGADLLVCTSIGMVSLAQAIQRDVAAIAPQAVSYPINDEWTEAQHLRGVENWQAVIWPEEQMVAVSPPNIIGGNEPAIYAVNANTMAWCRFTNWYALCFGTFQGQLYFGTTGGVVWRANVTGLDGTETYTGVYIPLFDDLGTPTNAKIPQMARAVLRSSTSVESLLTFKADYDTTLEAAPSSGIVPPTSIWGGGVWGTSVWGDLSDSVIDQEWQSVGGVGYACSVAVQVTSGAVAPLDTEIVRVEMTYTTAEVVS